MNNFSKHFKNNTERSDFLIALIVIFFFGLLFTYILLSSDSISEPKTNDTYLGEKTKLPTTLDERIIIAPEMVNWVDNLEKNEIKNTSTIFDTSNLINQSQNVIISNKDNKAYNEVEVLTNKKNKITDLIEDTTIIKDTTKIIIETTKESKTTIDSTSNDDTIIVNDYPKSNCVIILGAFSNINNLERLKSKLLQTHKQRELYQSIRKGYNVIGVYIDCKSSFSKLNHYKDAYTREAWLLKI